MDRAECEIDYLNRALAAVFGSAPGSYVGGPDADNADSVIVQVRLRTGELIPSPFTVDREEDVASAGWIVHVVAVTGGDRGNPPDVDLVAASQLLPWVQACAALARLLAEDRIRSFEDAEADKQEAARATEDERAWWEGMPDPPGGLDPDPPDGGWDNSTGRE